MLRSNVGPFGTLDTDKFLRAILQLRNTPDPDCGVSPAEIVFGRRLRDNLLFTEYVERGSYSKRWQQVWAAKEEALRARFIRTSEKINQHCRDLPPLMPGDRCFVQNQFGHLSKKWHRSGVIMEVLPHDQYSVLVDGSSQLTIRNRRFLKKYTPATMTIGEKRPQPPPLKINLTRPIDSSPKPADNCGRNEAVNLPARATGDSTADMVDDVALEESPTFRDAPLSPVRVEPAVTTTPSNRLPLTVKQLKDFNARGIRENGGDDSLAWDGQSYPRRSSRLRK